MRKLRRSVCLLLVLSLTTGVLAADPGAMTDIEGHWAYSAIADCMDAGLFQGVSDTAFDPDGSMTRGMFVTVLGRLAGVDETEYQTWYQSSLYTDVSAGAYYSPYVTWATRYGIVNGMGNGCFAPEEKVTREQIATMIVRFLSIYNYELSTSAELLVDAFTDADRVSDYAADSVEALRMTGVINGYDNGDGTYRFEPQGTATRAECAAIFSRVRQGLSIYDGREIVEPQALTLEPTALELRPGDWSYLSASISPADTTNQTVTWFSTDRSVATVDQNGMVTAVAAGTADICGITWNGLEARCTVTVTQSAGLAYAGESYEDKCIRIFGQIVDDYHTYYDTDDTSYLVTIPVRVWDFTDSTYTEKYTKTIYLQVHANIADTVKAIFEEIYNGDEQFPIHSAGGYYRSTYSEHTPGLAIDINPNENYECTNDGTALTGSYWKPGEDPYSIPADGDVVNAFRKYGFGWGADWNSKKDYMHFSYFGT